jgi:ribonucleotide monophosphatase NagD (HAD superfamily)
MAKLIIASSYGFKSVVTPGDILVQHPNVWPFSHPFLEYYRSFARPLPRPIDALNASASLKIDATFVYNDSRDWGLDATIILDTLLSREGIMGTLSPKNDNPDLPNRGYLQDGQPPLYFSNPDLWWAAKFHLPRLGQGAFRESLEGLWTAVTGGEKKGVTLEKTLIGKPYYTTYEFAERKLLKHRKDLLGASQIEPLRRVYMVGDNPGMFSSILMQIILLIWPRIRHQRRE